MRDNNFTYDVYAHVVKLPGDLETLQRALRHCDNVNSTW